MHVDAGSESRCGCGWSASWDDGPLWVEAIRTGRMPAELLEELADHWDEGCHESMTTSYSMLFVVEGWLCPWWEIVFAASYTDGIEYSLEGDSELQPAYRSAPYFPPHID